MSKPGQFCPGNKHTAAAFEILFQTFKKNEGKGSNAKHASSHLHADQSIHIRVHKAEI